MTKEQRDKLRTLALAATPGEWEQKNTTDVFGPLAGDSGDGTMADSSDAWLIADCNVGLTSVNGELAVMDVKIQRRNAAYIAAANPATLLALLDRVDELDGELAASKVDAERYKRELQQKELVHVGYTNPYQIKYAKDEEGSFYPDTDNECYIPLYMLKKHKHRLGPDAAIDKARGR